ncbi:MAG: PLP-dependent aminotransferase family protein [Eggerthellaceae bacterium]|nr:PLP-dependent aminotransferase family protein [Eggerthellaceae bacterium]
MGNTRRREILFTVDAASAQPLYRQVYEQARDAIVEGRLHAGERLPSIRKLATTLSLSHTTIEQAYLQLSVEGYVRNVPRSGYMVERLDTKFLRLPKMSNTEASVQRALDSRNTDAFAFENAAGGKARYDFSYANLPADSFPANTWRKIVADVLYAHTAPELAAYAYTHEPSPLRRQLAAHLARTRGVNCVADQVVPQAGTDGALATVLSLFDPHTHVFGMEEPGYATAIEVARRMGFTLSALPSDQGTDAFISSLDKKRPKVVFCTPSHQFPTGAVMPLEARTRLLQWAQAHNAYIVEDDSCNEYRYDTAPIPSLQSLDAYHRVVYLGNVSKVLSPALRVAYLVLPPKLLGRYLRLFNYAHPPIPYLEQEVLARFMEQGLWDAHVRRMAHAMHKRHDALLACLEDAMGDHLEISGKHAGMHFYVGVDNGMDQEELVAAAQREGAAVYSTRRMWFSHRKPAQRVMVGFSSIPPEDIPAGVAALKRAWLG